ncbi:MAG: hypothetical protein KYX68_09395 [Flavobacterium sp.]|nr:hypothetical protein [Flavobacterium sp.]
MLKNSILIVIFLLGLVSKAQTLEEQIGYLLTDALFYSDRYIVPATDAAVYQASSSWMNSAKKKEKWQLDLGVHANVFFVPNRDRKFTISNNDFQFFQIENSNQTTVPTALGNDSQVYLVGDLDGQQVRFKTPEGINQESVVYPYLQVSLGLPYGFEVVGRYSTRTKLKKGDYQVYGFGLKHNFSQYFSVLETKKINLSFMTMYSNEEISFEFLDVETGFGNLGLNQFTAKVNTYHFQLALSKEIKDFEVMGGFIANVSNFNYRVYGNSSETSIFGVAINQRLPELEQTKWNYMGELSGVYHFSKFFAKTSFTFGKFVNLNIGINYTIS